MARSEDFRDQLESLHTISVEIAGLHEMTDILQRALDYCVGLTASELAFIGLLVKGPRVMDVAAIRGVDSVDPEFYDQFHLMFVRSSVVGVVINTERAYIANDVVHDRHAVGQPPGHPPVRKFLGVPLRVGPGMIGMIGVANKPDGYGDDDQRIVTTLANQVAVAIENARLYERQREMIASLQQLQRRLTDAERDRLLARERERIAGGLHDQIEQEIFSIGLGIDSLLEGDLVDPPAAERLRALRQVAVATADEARQMIFALAVPGAGKNGLASAVRSLLLDLERRSEVEAHLVVKGTAGPGVERVQEVVYSVINEALTNVERHAQARTVLVSIRLGEERIDVVIQDDGVGVPDPILTSFEDSYLHFGLRHMSQQVRGLGGTFAVADGEESGTIVRFGVPVPAPPE